MLNAIIKLRGQISLLKQMPSHMATQFNPYTAQGLISPKSARTIKQQNAKSSLLLGPSDIMSHFCTLDQDSVAQSLPGVPKYSECPRSSDPPLSQGPSPMSELPPGGRGCTASPLSLSCQDACCSSHLHFCRALPTEPSNYCPISGAFTLVISITSVTKHQIALPAGPVT